MHTLRVVQPIWVLGFLGAMILGTVSAQEGVEKPAPQPQIVRVRVGNSCGWCTEGYHDIETIVQPGRMVIVNRSDSDKQKYPDLTQEYTITERNWRDLQRLIEAKVLPVFANTFTNCPGCADEPIAWVEVQFNDGSKRSITYLAGEDPEPVIALRQKISAIRVKAKPRQGT